MPSAIAMPPPPSPSGSRKSSGGTNKPATPTFSTASNETAVDDDLESITSSFQLSGGLSEQSMLAKLRSPSRGGALKDELLDDETISPSRQDLLDVLEQENARLRNELDDNARTISQLQLAESERDEARSRAEELEGKQAAYERSLKERGSRVESLEADLQAHRAQLDNAKAESQTQVDGLQNKVDECESLIATLRASVEAKSTEAGQIGDVLTSKDAEIARLDALVKETKAESDQVREELSAQVDELRQAGQETIALYEERLGAAESRRFELEDVVEELEEKIRRRAVPTSPRSGVERGEAAAILDEAAQIDNETLREQALHLQRKVAALEDELEAMQAMNVKEESAVRSRIQRYKDAEMALRNEVADLKKEMERMVKSEASAKTRVEEIEEALRENTLALENARAEVEGLSSELAVSYFDILARRVLIVRCRSLKARVR